MCCVSYISCTQQTLLIEFNHFYPNHGAYILVAFVTALWQIVTERRQIYKLIFLLNTSTDTVCLLILNLIIVPLYSHSNSLKPKLFHHPLPCYVQQCFRSSCITVGNCSVIRLLVCMSYKPNFVTFLLLAAVFPILFHVRCNRLAAPS